MPVIASSELRPQSPFLVVEAGLRLTLGWQGWPESEGGPGFVVVRRGILGSIKDVERFPLTEEGWADAWWSLAGHDSLIADIIRDELARRQARIVRVKQDERQPELEAQALAYLPRMTFLGGYLPEAELERGNAYDLRFLSDRLAVFPEGQTPWLADVPYLDVEDVEIGGPGLIKTGGGFTGGGIGLASAAEGVAIAAVLNTLTSRVKIKTVLRVQSRSAEIFFLNRRLEPDQLRIELSRALGAIRQVESSKEAPTPADRPSEARPILDELERLASLLDRGLLTREEFDTLKSRLIGGASVKEAQPPTPFEVDD